MGGSSSKSQTVGFRYSFDIHFALGLPLDEIIEIRASDKTAWKGNISNNGQIRINAPNLFGGDKGEGGLDGTLDVLFGEETQGVLPKLAAMLGGIVPAFRGITTGFYSGLITSINPYPKPWQILRRGGNRLWGTQAPWYPGKQFIWLADNQIKAMNPAHILYLIYTGRKFRGLPRERMDEASWVAAADALYSEGLGLCLEWRKTDSFKSFRDAVLAHISAEVYVNRYTGLLSIRLLRSDYDVNSLPLFDEDSGLLEVLEEESSSVDNASVPSEVLIDYIDAITGETRQVRAVNAAVAARDGGRSAETISYPGAPTFEVAARLAVRDLRIKTSGLKRYKVTLDRRGRSLTPGQPFRLRSTARGIAQVVVRAGRIEDGTLTDGRMTVVALQDVFGLDFNNFVTPPPAGWEPPNRTPQAIVIRRIIEASYRDVVQSVDPANLSLIDPTQAYIAALAVAPTSLSQSYTLVTRVGSSGSFVEGETGDWCPTALCAAVPLQATATTITLSGGFRLEDVAVGSAALIDNEIVRVDAINLSASTVTVARGCVDTVPAAHADGARIWFYEDASVADETSYSAGVTLQAKLLTNTSQGQLSEALAATDSLTLQGRQGRPYPPANVRINDQYYPESVYGEVTISWSHRDRLLQSDQLIDALQGSIGPEAGISYQLSLYSGSALISTRNLPAADTAFTYALATEIAEGGPFAALRIELSTLRDSLASLQRYSHELVREVPPASPYFNETISLTFHGVWSLRARISSYSGPLLRIRDTATQQEYDLGADANGLLAAYSVAGAARITRLYDQSGNGNHLMQSNTALQPLLEPHANAHGGPRINFSGGSYLYGTYAGSDAALIPALNPHPVLIAAFNRSSIGTGQRGIMMIPQSSVSNVAPWSRASLWEENSYYMVTPDGANASVGGSITAGQAERFVMDLGSQSATTMKIYRNSGTPSTGALDGTINYPSPTTLIVGATTAGAAPFNGLAYEFAIASGPAMNAAIANYLMTHMSAWFA